MAVEYAKVREQFGRTTHFQAHAANNVVNAEQTTAATWDAARATTWTARVPAAVAGAHAIRTRSSTRSTHSNYTAAFGFTWEHNAHMYPPGPALLPAIMATDRPLFDVVDGPAQRQCTRRIRSRLPEEAEEYRKAAATPSARCASLRRSSGATSWWTPATWCALADAMGRAGRGVGTAVIEEEFQGVDRADMGSRVVTLTIAPGGNDDQRERWVEPVLRGR